MKGFYQHQKCFVMLQTLNTQQLVYMAIQIIRGVQYLHRKKIIHKDIATRNCVWVPTACFFPASFAWSSFSKSLLHMLSLNTEISSAVAVAYNIHPHLLVWVPTAWFILLHLQSDISWQKGLVICSSVASNDARLCFPSLSFCIYKKKN